MYTYTNNMYTKYGRKLLPKLCDIVEYDGNWNWGASSCAVSTEFKAQNFSLKYHVTLSKRYLDVGQ